jgi:hypothetical protein
MKKAIWLLALLVGLGLTAGCGTQDDFKDSLTFGTGITGTGFTLTGEATSFSLATLAGGQLWFRLESAADIDGRFVRLYFNGVTNKDYTAVQKTGHITLSSFPVTTAGTYQVKGYYVQTVIDIGKETAVASNTFTLTQ